MEDQMPLNESERIFYYGIDEVAYMALMADFSLLLALKECISFVETIANATSVLVQQDPNNRSGVDENGTWTGALGMIQRKEIDMYTMPMSLDHRMLSVADVSNLYMYTDIMLMSKSYAGFQFPDILDAFQNTDWRVIVLLFVSMWSLISLHHLCTLVLRHVNGNAEVSWSWWNYGDTIAKALAQLDLSKGVWSTVRILCVLFATLMFLFMALIDIFMTTCLVVQDHSMQIETIQDIFRNPKIQPFAKDNVSIAKLVKSQATEELRKIWELYTRFNNPDVWKEWTDDSFCGGQVLVNGVMKKRVVILMAWEQIAFCSQEYCENVEKLWPGSRFHVSKNPFIQMMLGIVIRKDVPSWKKKILKKMSFNALENGVAGYWRRRLNYEVPNCMNDDVDDQLQDVEVLQLHVFKKAFTFWVGGMTLALVVHIIEVVCARLTRLKMSQSSME